MVDYVVACLDDSSKGTEYPITVLLDVVQVYLSKLSTVHSMALLASFTKFYQAIPATSNTKRTCVEFIANVLIPRMLHNPNCVVDVNKWICSMPKVLWQLQDKHIETSDLMLSMLLMYCSTKEPTEDATAKCFDTLQKQITPLFLAHRKTKDGDSAKSVVYGPFLKLPVPLQQKAIRILSYLPQTSTSLLQAMCGCCNSGRMDDIVFDETLEILYARSSDLDLTEYISALMSLLKGNHDKESRVEKLCWSIKQLDLGLDFLHIVSAVFVSLASLTEGQSIPPTLTSALLDIVGVCTVNQKTVSLPEELENVIAVLLKTYAMDSPSIHESALVKRFANVLPILGTGGSLLTKTLHLLTQECSAQSIAIFKFIVSQDQLHSLLLLVGQEVRRSYDAMVRGAQGSDALMRAAQEVQTTLLLVYGEDAVSHMDTDVPQR
eukprot:GFYU01014161.1.p1 GENE.GFYU01014161.1~~GFYU01014161.1.p1  ORF type:complete len:511 (-),score=91.06 GFYU01014161.1:180-1484(-)